MVPVIISAASTPFICPPSAANHKPAPDPEYSLPISVLPLRLPSITRCACFVCVRVCVSLIAFLRDLLSLPPPPLYLLIRDGERKRRRRRRVDGWMCGCVWSGMHLPVTSTITTTFKVRFSPPCFKVRIIMSIFISSDSFTAAIRLSFI